MTRIDDELLMAYADGELSTGEQAAIEARLAEDADARELVRRFREAGALARAAFATTLDEPVPPAMVAAIRSAAREAGDAGNVVAFPRRLGAWPGRQALALAASLALILGLGGGWWLAQPGADGLSAALEAVPSNQAVATAGGEVTPLSSFRDAQGRWCREFVRSGAPATSGIACRAGEGRWEPQIAVAVESADGDGYAPAEGDRTPLDAALERMGSPKPVTAEVEREALAAGWP